MSMNFSYDNKVFRALGKFVDCIILSTLWLALCIPIVTIGASTTALYYTVHKSIKNDKGYMINEFWSAFKSNFKKSTLIWLVQLIAHMILGSDCFIMFFALKNGSKLGLFFFFFVFLELYCVMWSILTCCYNARFEVPWKAVLKNSAILAIVHLPWSFLMLLIFVASTVLYMIIPALMFVGPALIFFVYEFILERIFRKYMSEEELNKELEDDMLANR